MRQVTFAPNFDAWKDAARGVLAEGCPPSEVLWVEREAEQASLDFGTAPANTSRGHVTVPRRFLETARQVARHSNPEKWGLLYRVLWRLAGGEPALLDNPADADVIALTHFEKEVSKDAYRMLAYIRFREVATEDGPWFVAWYEPEHFTVECNAKFFSDRFTNMRWSILTPVQCMHWDGSRLTFSEGVDRASAPSVDAIEPLWITYYSSIFNPARTKPKAMQAQLLKRNWKNLPEAAVIEPLLREAPRRTGYMLAGSAERVIRARDYRLAAPPRTADWAELREAARTCTACPLYKSATCTVFGEGPVKARVMFVGEQPGDQEDREGRAFVGPAGQLLNRALAAAGIDRNDVYVTNAVKHFKWEPRGKRRLHKTASARDIASCRPWLLAEIDLVRPELIVCLGVTATTGIFGSPLKIGEHRGNIIASPYGAVLVTVHPSALLRLPDPSTFDRDFEAFVRDLSKAGALPATPAAGRS